jgi:hypothetical protein
MMGWFKKEDEAKIPEKLRNLTSEQIIAKMEEAEKLGTDLTTLKAALAEKDTAINENANALTELQGKLRELEANRQPRRETNERQEISFTDDPEGYVAQEIAKNTTPVASVALNNSALMAKSLAEKSLDRLKVPGTNLSKGSMFRRYEADIDAQAKKCQLGQLQRPDDWIFLFNNVLGTKMDEILQAYADGKSSEYFVEPGSTNATRKEEVRQDEKLTDEELNIAKRMRIKPEDYLKQKKEFGNAAA